MNAANYMDVISDCRFLTVAYPRTRLRLCRLIFDLVHVAMTSSEAEIPKKKNKKKPIQVNSYIEALRFQ